MASFTSWCTLRNELRDAMASGDVERFFKTRIENSRQMSSQWDSMGMMKYYEFVTDKCTREQENYGEGEILSTVMGGKG